MIIARQKRKENIAEYLLYMWQVEDLIRANKFDMDSDQPHGDRPLRPARGGEEGNRSMVRGIDRDDA